MWDKYMIVSTLSAIVGVVLMYISMIQTIDLTLRYGVTWGMIVCVVTFLWAFMSLGEKLRS